MEFISNLFLKKGFRKIYQSIKDESYKSTDSPGDLEYYFRTRYSILLKSFSPAFRVEIIKAWFSACSEYEEKYKDQISQSAIKEMATISIVETFAFIYLGKKEFILRHGSFGLEKTKEIAGKIADGIISWDLNKIPFLEHVVFDLADKYHLLDNKIKEEIKQAVNFKQNFQK